MKIVKVHPAPGGWIVECDLGEPQAFLSGEAARAKAQELGAMYADGGYLAQVLVEDRSGAVTASTMIGPRPRRRPAAWPSPET